jgi:hypothetical protein
MRRTIIVAELVTVAGYVAFAMAMWPPRGIWLDWLPSIALALTAAWAAWTQRPWAIKAVIVAAAYIGLPHPEWLRWRIHASLGADRLGDALSFLWQPLIGVAQVAALVSALRRVRSDAPAA